MLLGWPVHSLSLCQSITCPKEEPNKLSQELQSSVQEFIFVLMCFWGLKYCYSKQKDKEATLTNLAIFQFGIYFVNHQVSHLGISNINLGSLKNQQ